MLVKLLPAQEEFMSLKHEHSLDIACYQGGYGSGKTFCGSLLGLMLCLKYPGIKGLVGALNMPMLRDTTMQLGWFTHLRDLGLVSGRDFKYNITEGKMYFNNGPNGFEDGSCVIFRHFEEAEKLRSLEVGFIEIEEMSLVPESTFKELLGRLRQSRLANREPLKTRRLFGHTNPEPAKGWLWKYFVEKGEHTKSHDDLIIPYKFETDGVEYLGKYRSINKIQEIKTDTGTHKTAYRLVIAPSTQNYFLPDDFIANLKASYDPEYYRINVMGEFGDYSIGLVTKGFSREKQVKQRIEYDYDAPLHLSCDFNVDPMCWVIAQKNKYTVSYLDEIMLEGGINVADAARHFMDRYPVGTFPRIILNGDASGQHRHASSAKSNSSCFDILEDELYKRGYSVTTHLRTRNPEKPERANAWNAMIRNTDGEHRIFIDERCKRLLYSIENLKWKAGTSDFDLPSHTVLKRERDLRFLDHPFDAASYLTEYYFPIERIKRYRESEDVITYDPRFPNLEF